VTSLTKLTVFGLSAILFLVLSGCRKQTSPQSPPAPGLARGGDAPCGGIQRWDVKTASDAGVKAQVNPNNPVATTIHDLVKRKSPNPWKVDLVRQINFDAIGGNLAVEKTVWQVNEVILVKFVLEGDNDIHLIVQDPDPKFKTLLNIEFPDTTCKGAIDSPFKAQMLAARNALIAKCGNPPKSYKNLKGTANLTGIGFFDKEHGAAASTNELHPALSFTGTCN
jgi:hypothetical protein